MTHPGVYCLRSSEIDWDEECVWCTYSMLTDLKAVFCCLKSELDLRPVLHHKEERVDGYLPITVLAYQFTQVFRRQSTEYGIQPSWKILRQGLYNQTRVTAVFQLPDDHTLHVPKAT